MLFIKLAIFYGSYIVFPFLYFVVKRRRYILIFLSIIFIYARFVEPKIVLVNHYKIETGFKAKYALVGDIHLGVYNDKSILETVVSKVNMQDVDALLIAGDFTYEADIDKLEELFAPLKDIKVPIYAVLGNHDKQTPNPNFDNKLTKSLEKMGVNIIDNRAVRLNGIDILGLGSRWADDDEVTLINNYTKNDNLVVLAHNPDTSLDYPYRHSVDITFSGHTHGGQIRLPWLYHYVIPIEGEMLWDKGVYEYKNHKVFVTTGIGEIGLPFRFLIPPVVDVIELY